MLIKRLLSILLFSVNLCYVSFVVAVQDENKTGYIEEYKRGQPLISSQIKEDILAMGVEFIDKAYMELSEEAECSVRQYQAGNMTEWIERTEQGKTCHLDQVVLGSCQKAWQENNRLLPLCVDWVAHKRAWCESYFEKKLLKQLYDKLQKGLIEGRCCFGFNEEGSIRQDIAIQYYRFLALGAASFNGILLWTVKQQGQKKVYSPPLLLQWL